MLEVHTCTQNDDDPGIRYVVGAVGDADLPDDDALRAALQASMDWAIREVMSDAPAHSVVP